MDDPSLYLGELLMESLREAEENDWHHSPRGSLEGDHYDRLVRAMRAWEVLNARD